jgi:hypothetical protein
VVFFCVAIGREPTDLKMGYVNQVVPKRQLLRIKHYGQNPRQYVILEKFQPNDVRGNLLEAFRIRIHFIQIRIQPKVSQWIRIQGAYRVQIRIQTSL